MPTDKTRYEQSVRYEVILDDGEDNTRWSDIGLTTAGSITTSTTHITGTKSISFAKTAGNVAAYILRSISSQGMDLNNFASEGNLFFSIYLSSLTNVVSVNARLLEDTSNYVTMSVLVADLAVGWNHLKVSCNKAVQTGTGVDWKAVNKLAIGVTFSGAGNTLTGILVDSVRIQIPTANVEFEAFVDNVNVGGSFAIKHGTNADEAIVNAADTARSTISNVLVTQTIGADGTVPPTGSANTNAPFSRLTDGVHDLDLLTASGIFSADTKAIPVMSLTTAGTVMGNSATSAAFVKLTDGTDNLDILDSTSVSAAKIIPTKLYDNAGSAITVFAHQQVGALCSGTVNIGSITQTPLNVVGGVLASGTQTANTSTSTATMVIPVKIVDSAGNSQPAGNSSTAPIYTADVGAGSNGIGGDMLYMSPTDFSATYATVSGVTLASMSYTPVIQQFANLLVSKADGTFASYSRNTNAFTYNSTTSVLSVGGASLAATDLGYLVMVYGPYRSYNTAADYRRVGEIDPLDQHIEWMELVDTATHATGTTYYPASTGMAMNGYKDVSCQFGLSALATLTVEATLDDADAPDWLDVTRACYEMTTDSSGNISWCNQNGILDLDNILAAKIRFKIVVITSTTAVQLHVRRKAL